jgi:diguanylate cyclase (GGDEF)-like protein
MNAIWVGAIFIPGVVSLLLLFVFIYLYSQSRENYFRAWELGWGAYCLHFALLGWNVFAAPNAAAYFVAKVSYLALPLAVLISTRLIRKESGLRWYDLALAFTGVIWAFAEVRAEILGLTSMLQLGRLHLPRVHIEVLFAGIFVASAVRFYRYARELGSLGLQMLSVALGFWAVLLVAIQFHDVLEQTLGNTAYFLGPLPQMLVSIAMVMVLYENERRTVQENLLAFSSLDLDPSRILDASDVQPVLQKVLGRLLTAFNSSRGLLWTEEAWRRTLPSVHSGFSSELLNSLDQQRAGSQISELVKGHGGKLICDLREGWFDFPQHQHSIAVMRELFTRDGARSLVLLSLATREHQFGVLIFPQRTRRPWGAWQMRLLTALASQLSMTLENFVLMQEAQRRTQEYELLTQIGQVVSSRLDPDEVLRTVQRELGRLFDTRTFYVAFLEQDEIRFELEVDEGKLEPKRSRKITNGITESIIRTGEPLLVRSDMEAMRDRLGFVSTGRPAKCFCGVPIFMYGRAVGVMAALNYEREFVYEQRDLEVMKTAAGQVAVAMENARLFSEEQRRSRYLAFLNNVSKTAISSLEPELMMAEIVGAIQNNFRFDHIGIGLLDYATKEIEIKAEAGTTEKTLGRRIPLGVGILGRVARTNEMALVQNASEGRLLGIVPESKSVLSIPITYGESLLGVLNVESRRENTFAPQEVLILRTLADLLATALHNAFVFQKMQQQSITDGLTGIKTRRFFGEALQSEWKRASRSGRPFSVVLIDLDKFKQINDTLGHLEGDLVLARVGRILEQKSRHSNIVARYGGDEFVILMPETGVDQAQILSERLRLWIATDPMLNERQITGSFGVAAFPQHGSTAEDILRLADMGMYNSKRSGGNRVSVPDDFAKEESLISNKQLVSIYIQGFLQREQVGPDSSDELVATLRKLGEVVGEEGRNDALMEAVTTLNQAAEAREVCGAGHGDAAAKLAEDIGRELALPPDELMDLIHAARLHDVGKVLLPAGVLNKVEPLTDEERGIIRLHPLFSAAVIETVPGCSQVAVMAKHHHERFDGAGYPDGLRGEEIPLGSRIIAVAEAFCNITTERPYAERRTPAQALVELEHLSGTQFDGMVVRTFLRLMKTARAAHSV